MDDTVVKFYCVIYGIRIHVSCIEYGYMIRNLVFACPYHYDSRDRSFSHADLDCKGLTFSETWLGFEQIYVESEVLSEFEMNFILCVDEATLHFDRAIVVIIAFLCFKDEGVKIHLEIIVALRAFLGKKSVTSMLQLQRLEG